MGIPIASMQDVAMYLSQARIVDLSKKVMLRAAEGSLDTGMRRYEIRSRLFPPGELMHDIDMESRISTHVEAPSHLVPALHNKPAADVSDLDLTSFFGAAILIDCKNLAPRTAIGRDILAQADIRQGDIVLIGKSAHERADRCYMAKDGAEYLAETKIKTVGLDDTVYPEHPTALGKDLSRYFTHDLMLSNGIPVIEGLANLNELRKQRFFFCGFRAKMGGLESFPIGAVAMEDLR